MPLDFDILLSELKFKTARSSGSGGQHVNKVSTKVEISFDVVNSYALTETEKATLIQKLNSKLTTDHVLILTSQATRSQLNNKKDAIRKFKSLMKAAFFVPKKRKSTRVPQRAIVKRLNDKKHQSELKQGRKKQEY